MIFTNYHRLYFAFFDFVDFKPFNKKMRERIRQDQAAIIIGNKRAVAVSFLIALRDSLVFLKFLTAARHDLALLCLIQSQKPFKHLPLVIVCFHGSLDSLC